MTGDNATSRLIDSEPRRWSEPVPIGEIIAVLRRAIEVRGEKTAREGRARTAGCDRLRKAG